MDTTLDGVLNRRVQLEQPADGYRVAVDTVLLAAAVPVQTGQKVLDMGCGVGGAMLCLACRVPGVAVTGIEIQGDLVNLCVANIARNALGSDLKIVAGDIAALPDDLSGQFDHVMMNPPYHDETKHDVSSQPIKRRANSGTAEELALWIEAAHKALRPSGVLTLIHRADRLDEILAHIDIYWKNTLIIEIEPKAGTPAKRIIVQARPGSDKKEETRRRLVLHKNTGGYSDEAEAILRHVQALSFGT